MSALRQLPSVDEVARRLGDTGAPHKLVVAEIRAVLEEQRAAIRGGAEPSDVESIVRARIAKLQKPALRRVINATGVILHTNLGRAPLVDFEPVRGYSNLEYDLDTGRRGKRDVHTALLLKALLGRDSIVVNNNASAVFLILHELAAGHEAIVSRGELIEIGDGFRIPEIMGRSGAILREVGTTNRTRIQDYEQAITERTRVILRVHPSNFQISGFTERPDLRALCELGREAKVPVYEDLGSGCLVDLSRYGVVEPLVSESLAAGVNLVSFSCDKLLGGPQSGIITGDAELVARVRRNPMYRAFRLDKLVIEALQATLRELLFERFEEIPTLRMIAEEVGTLRARAERIAGGLPSASVRLGESPIGGGSTPDQMLPTYVVELAVDNPVRLERVLRMAEVPVIARIERDRVLLDVRTILDEDEKIVVRTVRTCLGETACERL